MFTDTSPISVALKPASTQNGFTMKPIDASPSLKIRMNASTGQMCGRAMSSTSAPNIGPRVASVFAAGTRRLPIQQTASAATAVPSAIAPERGIGARPLRHLVDERERAEREGEHRRRELRVGDDPRELGAQRRLRVALDRALRRRGEHRRRAGREDQRRAHESARPGDPVGEDQHQPGGEHPDAVEPDPHAVRQPELVPVEQLDRVAVDRDVVGRGEQREDRDRRPHPRAEAGGSREHEHHRAHREVDRRHPVAVAAIVVDRRRPQELQRPGEPEQADRADRAEVDALLAEPDREDLVEDAEREALREVEEPDPEELGLEELRLRFQCGARLARYCPRSAHRAASGR